MFHVLVVDDSPIDRVLVEGLLKHEPDCHVVSVMHGREALEKLQHFTPQVILTDLQMPEMNGLQLLTQLRLQHPHIPVVLMTAMGSEQLAMQALEQGAASYVPKSQLSEKLVDTLHHVVNLSHSHSSYERLTQCMETADMNFRLMYDPAVFERLVELVQQMAVSLGLCTHGTQIRLGTALEEGLQYLFMMGNFELTPDQMQQIYEKSPAGLQLIEERKQTSPYAERCLYVSCRLSKHIAEITLRHTGKAITAPNAVASMESAQNRSLVLMRAFLDELRFSPAENQLVLIMHCHHASGK
jgi:CheY-like chemotaxis protein